MKLNMKATFTVEVPDEAQSAQVLEAVRDTLTGLPFTTIRKSVGARSHDLSDSSVIHVGFVQIGTT
jgi:hypothetical protein